MSAAAPNVGPNRQPTQPVEGFARHGIWGAIVMALVPGLQASVPFLAPIPAPLLGGAIIGGIVALGKMVRTHGGALLSRIGRLF